MKVSVVYSLQESIYLYETITDMQYLNRVSALPTEREALLSSSGNIYFKFRTRLQNHSSNGILCTLILNTIYGDGDGSHFVILLFRLTGDLRCIRPLTCMSF